jgi:hypothetical protein
MICCIGCSEVGPDQRTMTVSGVQNRDCTVCTNVPPHFPRGYNGTFVLQNLNQCLWGTTDLDSCIQNTPYWLSYDSTADLWTLAASPPDNFAKWTLSGSQFDCLASNTLSFVSANNTCQNWPSTVTVNPVFLTPLINNPGDVSCLCPMQLGCAPCSWFQPPPLGPAVTCCEPSSCG